MATSFEMTDDGGIRVRRGAASISRFEAEEVAELRALLSIPGLTPEEVQVALAERELEQALDDDIIIKAERHHWKYTENHAYVLHILGLPNTQCGAPTRLVAARAAVARTRELRAEAEAKLPEPEEMDYSGMHTELHCMGWRQLYGIEGYAHRQHGCIWNEEWRNGEYGVRDEFMRRALREARRLDGDAWGELSPAVGAG